MCTVTIIPKGGNNFVLTTNRDEAPNRISMAPDFYLVNNSRLLFPKDELSGGTWIGVSENNRLVCVLNGGFVLHERKVYYRESRGVVAKNILASNYSIENAIEIYNLKDVEPFTMVIADWNTSLKFYELVWDGEQKYFNQLSLEPKIWSSTTLYSTTMRNERLQWFQNFKLENDLNADSLLRFHKTAGFENEDYGVIMNRGFVKTTSITQVEKQQDVIYMHYENLQNKIVKDRLFNLRQIVNE